MIFEKHILPHFAKNLDFPCRVRHSVTERLGGTRHHGLSLVHNLKALNNWHLKLVLDPFNRAALEDIIGYYSRFNETVHKRCES